MGVYIDLSETGFYNFYYNLKDLANSELYKAALSALKIDSVNMSKINNIVQNSNIKNLSGVNKNVYKVLGYEKLGKLSNRNTDSAKIGNIDLSTGQMEFIDQSMLDGICMSVNAKLASEVVELSTMYCPVDTGVLRDSIRVEQDGNGCRIYYDCPYAWYVHEFVWRQHKFPTRAKFLSQAVSDVYARHGLVASTDPWR